MYTPYVGFAGMNVCVGMCVWVCVCVCGGGGG